MIFVDFDPLFFLPKQTKQTKTELELSLNFYRIPSIPLGLQTSKLRYVLFNYLKPVNRYEEGRKSLGLVLGRKS